LRFIPCLGLVALTSLRRGHPGAMLTIGGEHAVETGEVRKIYGLIKGDDVRITRERVQLIRRHVGLQAVRKRKQRKVLGMTTQLQNT